MLKFTLSVIADISTAPNGNLNKTSADFVILPYFSHGYENQKFCLYWAQFKKSG